MNKLEATHLRLTPEEMTVLEDGSAQILLALEERCGGQSLALEAHPELAETAKAVQSMRAKAAAAALGLELRGDGFPFAADVIAEARRVFQRIVDAEPDDLDPSGWVAATAGATSFLDHNLPDQGA